MKTIKQKLQSILKHILGLLAACKKSLVVITAPDSGTSICNRAVSLVPSSQPRAQNPLAFSLLLPIPSYVPKPHPFLFISTPLLRYRVLHRTEKNPPPTLFTKIPPCTQNSVPLCSAHANTSLLQTLLHPKPYYTSLSSPRESMCLPFSL